MQLLHQLALLTAVNALDVSVSLTAPLAAVLVSPKLIGLSIEMDRWTDWGGAKSRNDFFFNTLENVRARTGAPPDIRIGANSEDRTNFNAAEFVDATFPPFTTTIPYPEISKMIVGDEYYRTTRFLPVGTHVTWGVNFGTNNVTAAVLEAKSIVKAFEDPELKAANIVLEFLEIGNEPDLYRNNGLRSPSYNVSTYVSEWITFARNVSAAVDLPSRKTKFLAGSLATSSHTTTGFSPQGMYAAGLMETDVGKLIGAFSEHRYSGSFCQGNGGLLQDLMTKSSVRGNLTVFNPDIAATRPKNIDYLMGETNSYACHGAPGVSNTAGAALWTLDYALFAPLLGISKVFFHVGIGFKYNLLQPATLTRSILDGSPLPAPLPPHVQPQYYAWIIAAEAIGNTGTSKVVELSIDNTRVSGYAFYENQKLARAILINSRAFFAGATRTSEHINLKFPSGGPLTVRIKRLAIGHADDTSGITWGGQTYETSDGKVSGTLQEQGVAVAAGFDLAETEVVLLTFA